MKIHLLEADRFSPKALSKLSQIGNVSFGDDTDGLLHCQILFVRLKHIIDKKFIQENCPNVKFILSPTTGHDHLDEKFILNQNITLVTLRGEIDFLGSIPSTAEFTWTLLLALFRKLPQATSHAVKMSWNRDLFIGNNLAGKNIGILGFGRVGKQVAQYAKAFGMRVHTYDLKQENMSSDFFSYSDYDGFASNIDILSIHIPMNDANKNWLNKSRLSKLKKGIHIINTSRGGIWDEKFLYSMLHDNHCAGLATDVLEHELDSGLLKSSPIIQASKNGLPVIITPHIAGATYESMHMTEEFIVDKLLNTIGK